MYTTLYKLIPHLMSNDWLKGQDQDEEEEIQRSIVLLCDGCDSDKGRYFKDAERAMTNTKNKLSLVVITVGNDRGIADEKTRINTLLKLGSRSSQLFHATD